MLNAMMMMVMMIPVFEEKEVIFPTLNYVNLVLKLWKTLMIHQRT